MPDPNDPGVTLSAEEVDMLACLCHVRLCPVHNDASDGYIEHRVGALLTTVARIVGERERKARAGALREAADVGPRSTATDQLWLLWLRDRADWIEGQP